MQKQKNYPARFQVLDKRSTAWILIAKIFCFYDAAVKVQYLKILNPALSWFCGHSNNFIVLIQYSTYTSFPDHFLNVNPNKLSHRIPNPIQVRERNLHNIWLYTIEIINKLVEGIIFLLYQRSFYFNLRWINCSI